MDVKGINWVGDMYQKFENMCLEAEDIMYEDTVEYIETQIQTVGDSVKKLYSDIVGDLIPSISCILDEKEDSELPIDQQHTDAGFCKKPVQNSMERYAKVNTKLKQTNNGLRIDHNADNNNVIHKTGALFKPSSRSYVKKSNIVSRPRQYVGSMDIKSNLSIDVNKVNEKMAATKIFNELTSAEPDTRMPPLCSEILNEDQNHKASVSKPASDVVARLSSEEKQIEKCHNTMQEDHLKLEETCVMVTGDDLQLIAKEIANLKKTRRPGFSLSKKSARKQEYMELAMWHGNSEKVKGVPSVSESEWELL
ncbi:unnamed protein product [Trifolium pratense]|uniref:Uncharacterized protein n=1 Tax=Trifolium pratense TaxID=57577 RepID=A0ACB0LH36_TRIPR|nr:unnamed protein product [Trifolium pratense]